MIGQTNVFNKMSAKTFSLSVGTSWTQKTGYVQQTIGVSGLLSSDIPVVDLVTTTSGYEAQQEAWGKIFKIETITDGIIVYASDATETMVNIQLRVVR